MMTVVTGGSGSGKSAFAEDKIVSFGPDVYKRQRQIIMPLMIWATHVLQWRKQREANPRGWANLKNNVPVRTRCV